MNSLNRSTRLAASGQDSFSGGSAAVPGLPDRIQGGLIGLLVGDAVGVPYEFQHAKELPPLAEIEMVPPVGFHRSHASVPPGTWSDDGAQALCLLESLLTCGPLDLADFAGRLVAWRDQGHLAVDGRVFDVGIQTQTALGRLRQKIDPRQAGPSGEQDNGNGSLMRVLPLALWHQGPDAELAELACLQSQVTHGHARSQACCAVYCLWARNLLQGAVDPWAAAVATARTIWPAGHPLRVELDEEIRPEQPPVGTGSGYVLDSLHSARWAVATGTSFEDVVRRSVALGRDTDTTACVAGGIAGLQYGVQGIPNRWRTGLRGQALLDPLLSGVLQNRKTPAL